MCRAQAQHRRRSPLVLVSVWLRLPATTGRIPRPNHPNCILSDISRLTTNQLSQLNLIELPPLLFPIR